MNQLKISVLVIAAFTIICGLIYPALITASGYIFSNEKHQGSIVHYKGAVVGSEFIGQNFTRPEYFHSRPSAVNYDSSLSGGSNLSPTSRRLAEHLTRRKDSLRAANGLSMDYSIPSDLITSSASGIDPHISIESAMLQADRIAASRNIKKTAVIDIIHKKSERQLPFYGIRYVNVLKLNLTLDGAETIK